MHRLCRPNPSLRIALATCFVALATGCAVYEDGPPEPRSDGGGAAGAGGATGGAAGKGGSTGGSAGTGGTAEDDGGEVNDAPLDAEAPLPDVAAPLPDVRTDLTNDAAETDSPGDAGSTDTSSPPDVDYPDAPDASVPDANDAPMSDGSPDVASDGPRAPDADADAAARPDADAGVRDVVDSAPIAPQTLPAHGTPIEKPDAGGPFESRCASDEVVTGFVGRAGVQTDAIGSTCSNLIGGVLSSPRNLPLHGFTTGGNAFTVTCPANYAAVGLVGRYGHNTMWMEDVTTMIGVVCKALGSTTTQIVTITGQPALDSGYSSFREDCTGGRFLTVISGRTDSNSLGYTVQQVGGECNAR